MNKKYCINKFFHSESNKKLQELKKLEPENEMSLVTIIVILSAHFSNLCDSIKKKRTSQNCEDL
jgi:hypothetical protein